MTRRAPADDYGAEGYGADDEVVDDYGASDDDAVDGQATEDELWCETCQEMVPGAELDEDSCCPTCGEHVGGPRHVPLKFKLMIAASVIYLGYRAFQGVTWVIHHL